MGTKLWNFLRDESGQTTVEYILVLLVGMTLVMNFRKRILAVVVKLLGEVDKGTNFPTCDDGSCD